MVRICHVCSGHRVDDNRVFHRACRSLAQAGFDVHLIATGDGDQAYQEDGVTIHPLPECRSRRERFRRRSVVAQMASQLQPALFHVHEPELLGAVLGRSGGRPVVYDVHESYLDVLMERDWIPAPLRPAVRWCWDQRERQLVRRCAGIVVVTDPIAERYRKLHDKVVVVANFLDLSALLNLPPPGRDGKTCVFAGVLRPDRGLLQVVEALSLLRADGVEVRLELCGPVISDEYLASLWATADRFKVRDLVTYHGSLSKPEAIRLQHRASIGLIPYLPVANSMAGLPNKLVECMALGLPVVFSNFDTYRAVAGEGTGFAVDPTRPQEIAAAIRTLVADPERAEAMGARGAQAVRERFNWAVEREKMFGLYRTLLDQPEPVPQSGIK